MFRPCSTSATMLLNPASVNTTLTASLTTSMAALTAMPTSAWFIVDAVAGHASDVAAGL